MTPGRRLLRSAALLWLLCARLAAAQGVLVDQWYDVLLGGRQLGSLHVRTTGEADGTLRTELVQEMSMQRYGQPFLLRQEDTWLEDPRAETACGLLELHSRQNANGQVQELRVLGLPSGLELHLEREGGSSRLQLDCPGELLGPALAARALAEATAAGPVRYWTFSPEALTLSQVELRLQGQGELVDSRGQRHRGLLVEERSTALGDIVTLSVYAENAQLRYSRTPVGLPMEVIAVAAPAERGGAAAAAAPFEIGALNVPVKNLERLRGPAGQLQWVRLRFEGPGLELLRRLLEEEAWPEGAVALAAGPGPGAAASGGLEVRLGSASQSPNAPARADPATGGEASAYLRDGFYLDLQDPRLDGLLASCPGGEGAPSQAARASCLEALVSSYIERKDLQRGFASVAEVLSSRAGDCTEHALLLAALLRRAGVPARLVYGFLLTEAGFLGHAWTEAWVAGAWRWLDPSFPGAVPYAVKLPLGVIDPAEPMGPEPGLRLLQLAGGLRAEVLEAGFAQGSAESGTR